jgi:hypothetical protein
MTKKKFKQLLNENSGGYISGKGREEMRIFDQEYEDKTDDYFDRHVFA